MQEFFYDELSLSTTIRGTRKMMEACSVDHYHGPCHQTVLSLTVQLSENGKDTVRTFLNRLMTDGTKSVVGADFFSLF